MFAAWTPGPDALASDINPPPEMSAGFREARLGPCPSRKKERRKKDSAKSSPTLVIPRTVELHGLPLRTYKFSNFD